MEDSVTNIQELIEKLDELEDATDNPCLHESLEQSRPESKKGQPHQLACPCPKCTPRC